MICKFCNKISFNRMHSLKLHENSCKENPNRKIRKGTNQYTKAERLGIEKPKLSEETILRLREMNTGENSWWNTRKDASEIKKKQSLIMKKVAKNNPGSYSSSNRGRTKVILFDNIHFNGQWELDFYRWCKNNNLTISRNNEPFEYEFENQIRSYFPDFYLEQFNCYVEVKGYETDKDRAKWKCFNQPLLILRKNEIFKIKKNLFKIDDLLSCTHRMVR